VTQLLDGSERDRLIERRDVVHDRRLQAIYLTEEGRRLFNDLVPPISRNLVRFFAPLSPAERQTLIILLAKLAPQNPALAGE
jgi:DNA-binding MarR family transcriptional regulator